MLTVLVAGLGTGSTGLSPLRLAEAVHGGLTAQERIVLRDIRMPRLFLGLLVGGGLAVSGVLMQALFRNPLADPVHRGQLPARRSLARDRHPLGGAGSGS